jgi:predicted ester cyclase
MKGLLKSMPDGRYDLISSRSIKRQNVSAYARFLATHTGKGGPCPPIGKNTKTNYIYIMEFEGDKIRHMTKI